MRTKMTLVGVATALWLVSAAIAQASPKTLWQIGQFDNSYAEFAIAGDYGAYRGAFPNGVRFRVGVDDPAKAWPFIQPGPDDIGWAGKGAHPFTIDFQLPEAPNGVCTLTLDLVSTQGAGAPTCEITVNDQKTSATLPTGPGDAALTNPTKGKERIVTIPFRASILKQGNNRIVLNTTSGSWMLYDALQLTNDPDASLPPVDIKDLSIAPTSRVISQSGKNMRIVVLSARLSRGMTRATATLRTPGGAQQLALNPNSAGEARIEALVEDLPSPVHAEAVVTCENATRTASWEIASQRHWKLYMELSSHVDIGFTDYQERAAQRHNENTNVALDLIARYPEFKWNTEVGWVEDNYLSMKPKPRQAEFLSRAKEGRIGCPAVYGNMLTGICSHEELIRDLYYTHGVAKHSGLPFDTAMSSDVPTQVWTLPTILAQSGIRYFSAGLNLGRGDSANRPLDTPFYWQGPDGSRVLTWYSRMYGWVNLLSLSVGIDAAAPKIDEYLRPYDRQDYPCDAVFAFGGLMDNLNLNASLGATIAAWNKRYVSPKIIPCRGPDFFQYLEKNWKGELPVISGDGGVCWEDGAASSAMETASVRRAKETLIAAEKLSALTSTLGKPTDLRLEFESAWKNAILYDEHTWGAAGSISEPDSDQTRHQWRIKAAFANEAARHAESALAKSVVALANLVKISEPSIIVYNPLSWPASGLVETTTADGKPIIFRAENIPPLGYRTYSRKKLPSLSARPAPAPQGLTLSNRFYTLRIDPTTGAVTSLRDNDLNRELVDPGAKYGINQYLYLTGSGRSLKEVTRDEKTPPVRVSLENRPSGKALVIHGSGYNTPQWTSEIILRDDEKRIDFNNTLQKKETRDGEVGYFAFPFRLEKPRFHVELPCGVLQPDKQMQPGGCMQWYCLQDFVAAEDDNCAITWTALDSPLVTLSDINHETGHGRLPLGKGHLFAYVFNNHWGCNYKASQGGKMVFRFSLTSSRKYDPVHSARFGQSVRTPLIGVAVSASKGPAPGAFTFCSVSPDNVEIQSAKQAERGTGLILRLRELSGRESRATVRLSSGEFARAWSCNLMEDPLTKLKITHGKLEIPLRANGLATVRLIPAR